VTLHNLCSSNISSLCFPVAHVEILGALNQAAVAAFNLASKEALSLVAPVVSLGGIQPAQAQPI